METRDDITGDETMRTAPAWLDAAIARTLDELTQTTDAAKRQGLQARAEDLIAERAKYRAVAA
jgi:hypothetical protein